MKSTRENLILLNVPRTVAVVIEVLSDGEPHSLRDIEREGDLRQPEVCLAVESLSAYLTITAHKNPGKGRAQKIVALSRKAYCNYINACVECYRVAYDAAVEASKELKK